MAHKDIHANSKEGQAYQQLLDACLSISPEQNLTQFDSLKVSISHLSQKLHEQIESFKKKISKISLSSFIILWADQTAKGHELEMMCELVEDEVLPLIKLEKFKRFDSSFIIERIRRHLIWKLSKREAAVLLYTSFAFWLSKETFGYVSPAQDLDRLASQKRAVAFETYNKILDCLDLREQILAKMFYLGGQRGLEEVLSVKIEDIDFIKRYINFPERVFYPQHLFDDIEVYKEDRKKGFLFLGKDGERIAHTTPFRALKKMVTKLKLDPEFTFRELTKNI
jgi:integrase